MFIELTYFKLMSEIPKNEHKINYFYTHQALTVQPEAIKWLTKNHAKIKVLLNNSDIQMITPLTKAYVEGLGEVFLKEERMLVRDIIQGKVN